MSFEKQLIVLAAVFDPLGFELGYLLGPSVGADALIGGVFGVVVANIPTSLCVLREASSR